MKNVTKISMIIVLALASISAGAQNFGYHYSGYSQTQDVLIPQRVIRVVNLYPEFAWVGTTQVQRGHSQLYIVTLHHGNRFLELTINERGDIISRNRYVHTYQVITYPYYSGYSNKKVIYHDDGYVYSRNWNFHQSDYSWQNNRKQGTNWHKNDKNEMKYKDYKDPRNPRERRDR